MAKKMELFHALPQFRLEKCPVYQRPPWLGSVSTRFENEAGKICYQRVLFRYGTTRRLLYQQASLRYQRRCT